MKNLANFIENSEDPVINFELGKEYESIGQTGAAISFYLRTAERSSTDLQQYEALMRCCVCLEKQKTRDDTEKGLLLKSIALLPTRPEAYFLLSRVHEHRTEWQESYSMAVLGLELADFGTDSVLPENYPGYYGLLFQKGMTSWWVGLTEQSRQIMLFLKDHYKMLPVYETAVNNNLKNCGLPKIPLHEKPKWNNAPDTVPLFTHTYYDSSMVNDIRLRFDGINDIKKNFSQSYQDLFVLAATKGKRNGQYLEIGSAEPFYGNNTALLETMFDWKGLSIEYDLAKVKDFEYRRKNPVICTDATTVDYAAILATKGFTKDIDYLQVDCDPPEISFGILKSMPFDQYRFAVITFEHDHYWNQNVRDQSREFLKRQGYELLVSDLAYNKVHSYEDWWVHPELVDEHTRNSLRAIGNDIKFATDYMFPPSLPTATVAITTKSNITRTASTLINQQPMPGIWIVDNFYQNPDEIRKFALAQEYDQGGFNKPYIGDRTKEQFLFPGLREEFEYIMNRKIVNWESHAMNGRFQVCKEGEPLVYHCDEQAWAAMLYLTPNAPYHSGTATHALKGTDIRHISHPEISRCFRPGSRNLDRTIFEPVDSFGNVYNRLVIFNAGYIHSATDYFGFNNENSRLWQMFFFD
jgi:hypothetical protein